MSVYNFRLNSGTMLKPFPLLRPLVTVVIESWLIVWARVASLTESSRIIASLSVSSLNDTSLRFSVQFLSGILRRGHLDRASEH